MNIEPIGERVLLQPTETKDKTDGGIYIPDEAKEDKKEGTAVATGELDDGGDIPLSKGETVLYGGYSNEEFERGGQEYVVVKYKDILAKIND